tara:strand:+ start:212 stop:430 length:219 start_codon:yes stop_codon:yes gene_type:complete
MNKRITLTGNMVEVPIETDDHLKNCNGCNKIGSLKVEYAYKGYLKLWSAEWDENIYCNDCIPERWNRILEQS